MRRNTVKLPAQRPRNAVVLAIVRRLASAASQRHQSGRRPNRQQAERDLAQRVRESGEW